jgi:hypothetical protein
MPLIHLVIVAAVVMAVIIWLLSVFGVSGNISAIRIG